MSDYEKRITTANFGKVLETSMKQAVEIAKKQNGMNRDEYLEFFKQCLDRMYETTLTKNQDYAGHGDPFANFSNVANCGGATPEQGFLIRLNDKMARISNFVKNGELAVKDESVQDTLMDAACYSILFMAYLESEKAKND